MSNPAAAAAAAAAAVAADDVDPSRWESFDDTGGTVRPWLYDPDGNILRLPARCSGFQVRFWTAGARGSGELVTDEDTGLPLFVPRTTGPEEFQAMVCHKGSGRFRLFLLDEDGQKMRHVPAQIAVTKKMARAAGGGDDVTLPPVAVPVGGELFAQILAIQADQFKAVLAQQAQAMTQHSHQMDMVGAQVGRLTEAVAGILTSAGGSGLLPRGDSRPVVAVAAPTTTQGSAAASTVPPTSAAADAPPRDAAAANANRASASTKQGGATPLVDEDDAEEEKRSGASMMAEMFKPFAEKLAPVAAYSAAKAMHCSEEQAREFAGMTGGAVSKGLDILVGNESKPVATSEVGATEAASEPPLSGEALRAHVAAIRARLSADAEAVLMKIGARHYPRYDELTALVGTMAVEDGVATIGKVAAIWRELDEAERSFLHRMIDQSGFRVLMKVAEQDTVDQALRLVRRAKAAHEAQGSTATAA